MKTEVIIQTPIKNYLVSTIKLPFGSQVEEEVYETMVFESSEWNRLGKDVDVEVCSTLGQALKNHTNLMKKWSENTCFSCGDPIPVGSPVYQDQNEYGDKIDLFLCDSCGFDRFGKDDGE